MLLYIVVLMLLAPPPSAGQVQCFASCAAIGAYQILQKNEASKRLKNHRVTGFDVNFLGSNSPIEDRFVIGSSDNIGLALFSVIDGHKGTHCSHYLQNNMLQHVVTALHETGKIKDQSDLNILLDMTRSALHNTHEETLEPSDIKLEGSLIAKCLKDSLSSLDNLFCNEGLEKVKLIQKGHSMTPEMKEAILTAIEGACSLTTVVRDDSVFVANTGDCRAVIGRQESDNSWSAIPLSDDQNALNPAEVKRLQNAHPGEPVILQNRLLGSLMPFRTFGDADFKWEKKYLQGLVPTSFNYETPPYVTAEPVVTQHTIARGDRFMIIGSDGLWERVSNKEAVEIVAETLQKRAATEKKTTSFLSSIFGGGGSDDDCCHGNAATELLWRVLGGDEESVQELLNLDASVSRMYRDDITIIVVYF